MLVSSVCFFFFSSRRRHTRFDCDWSSDVCSSDLRSGRGGACSASAVVVGPRQQFELLVVVLVVAGDHGDMAVRCHQAPSSIGGAGPLPVSASDAPHLYRPTATTSHWRMRTPSAGDQS